MSNDTTDSTSIAEASLQDSQKERARYLFHRSRINHAHVVSIATAVESIATAIRQLAKGDGDAMVKDLDQAREMLVAISEQRFHSESAGELITETLDQLKREELSDSTSLQSSSGREAAADALATAIVSATVAARLP